MCEIYNFLKGIFVISATGPLAPWRVMISYLFPVFLFSVFQYCNTILYYRGRRDFFRSTGFFPLGPGFFPLGTRFFPLGTRFLNPPRLSGKNPGVERKKIQFFPLGFFPLGFSRSDFSARPRRMRSNCFETTGPVAELRSYWIFSQTIKAGWPCSPCRDLLIPRSHALVCKEHVSIHICTCMIPFAS